MPTDDYTKSVFKYIDVIKHDFKVSDKDTVRAKEIVKEHGWIPADPKTYAASVVYSLGYDRIKKYLRVETIRNILNKINV